MSENVIKQIADVLCIQLKELVKNPFATVIRSPVSGQPSGVPVEEQLPVGC